MAKESRPVYRSDVYHMRCVVQNKVLKVKTWCFLKDKPMQNLGRLKTIHVHTDIYTHIQHNPITVSLSDNNGDSLWGKMPLNRQPHN